MLSLLLLFQLILVDISWGSCPDGAIPSTYSNPENCYFFEKNKLGFMDAEKICQNLGGHLASIHNAFDNDFLRQNANSKFNDTLSSDFWSGANRFKNPGVWSWMDGTPFDFTDWDKGQPSNGTANSCGTMKLSYEKWSTDDCNKEKPYVCEITVSNVASTTTTKAPESCPILWSSFGTFCYKVYENLNWQDGEDQCKFNDAHLASIHNLEEAIFVANLANYPGNSVCFWEDQAWFGLFTEDSNAHWNWTDGTPFDYSHWIPTQPDYPGVQNCGYIQLADCPPGNPYPSKIGDFDNAYCNVALPKIVCKKPM